MRRCRFVFHPVVVAAVIISTRIHETERIVVALLPTAPCVLDVPVVPIDRVARDGFPCGVDLRSLVDAARSHVAVRVFASPLVEQAVAVRVIGIGRHGTDVPVKEYGRGGAGDRSHLLRGVGQPDVPVVQHQMLLRVVGGDRGVTLDELLHRETDIAVDIGDVAQFDARCTPRPVDRVEGALDGGAVDEFGGEHVGAGLRNDVAVGRFAQVDRFGFGFELDRLHGVELAADDRDGRSRLGRFGDLHGASAVVGQFDREALVEGLRGKSDGELRGVIGIGAQDDAFAAVDCDLFCCVGSHRQTGFARLALLEIVHRHSGGTRNALVAVGDEAQPRHLHRIGFGRVELKAQGADGHHERQVGFGARAGGCRHRYAADAGVRRGVVTLRGGQREGHRRYAADLVAGHAIGVIGMERIVGVVFDRRAAELVAVGSFLEIEFAVAGIVLVGLHAVATAQRTAFEEGDLVGRVPVDVDLPVGVLRGAAGVGIGFDRAVKRGFIGRRRCTGRCRLVVDTLRTAGQSQPQGQQSPIDCFHFRSDRVNWLINKSDCKAGDCPYCGRCQSQSLPSPGTMGSSRQSPLPPVSEVAKPCSTSTNERDNVGAR